MNEIILELAALLLSLFCLIYSVTVRRELYAPQPRGALQALKNQHIPFLAMLVSVLISAATSVSVTLGQSLHIGAAAMVSLNMAYFFFHNTLPFFFALYILNLCGPARKQRAWFFIAFALPMLFAQALLLTNPFTHLCFSIDAALTYHRGPGLWMLYAVAGVYAVAGFTYFVRHGGALSGMDRAAALILIAVCMAGVAVQAVWAVPVELFFESIAFFGFMAMLEHDEDASESGMSNRFRGSAIIAVTLTFLAVIVMNVSLILNLTLDQSDEIGNIRMDVIRSDLEDAISEAETNVLHLAIDAETTLAADPSREALARFFETQREGLLSNESFMNVFIAGSDWHIIPGFDAPPDFHASERVWFIGAKDHPGEVYITEPYIDANTGDMCFTVSTLLSDGETVVGMDLNFSKAQESILRMTDGTDQVALIVTAGGLIAGYTDMSLVGKRAEEKLPEYAEVLRRVASSNEHGSFRVTIDERPCMVFSSETSNNWYLILSVDTGTLYAESYRRIAMMTSVDLLMLVVVVVFYILSSRNRMRTMEALAENRRIVDGLAVRVRQSATQILRLSDAQVADGSGQTGVLEEIRESGQDLNALADNVRSYSDLLRSQTERAGRQRKQRRSLHSGAITRSARNGIIVTLVFAMGIGLFLCVHSTTSWGNTRMNREADSYENQLNEWLAQQQSILCMFTDVISSQPALMEDYDAAVRWLNAVAVKYPQISACYMANPYMDPPVIMNNGWIPGEDERPETRLWYRETERSANGFNISAPYMDAQTGNYCITLSRVVYGENDEFLGIFGIDFFLDKLINVLGESYTRSSYAFLVDSAHVIINHPNADYQMDDDNSVSVEDTEYAEAYNRGGITVLKDYSGRLVSCLSRPTSYGFTVLVANRWWSIYGSVVFVTLSFLVLFGFCIAVIVLLINRMIRWQKEVNGQLVEAADAAMKVGKTKSQFLARMSHEMRTPMNAIIGLDNLALRDTEVPPHTREQLEKIDASARHLLSLINDILDMSRIESGRMVLREETFAFRDFLNQINVIIGGQCADKGLRYVCNAEGATDDCFIGDDLKLKQVIINILGNAVKFTDAPGSVTFTVEETACDESGCVLRFTMKDTGIGMDEAFIPQLFEAFSQEDATNTNRYGGSGLGMAITRSIVEMMGGEIGVRSEKGVGTTFTVSVPLKRAHRAETPSEQAEEQASEGVSLEGIHVLIAEDVEINAEVLADLLELEGISSEWAENGKLAVERFAQSDENHFDAVLMDMRMPVMDGFAATRGIRALDRPDAKTVPIVALTANAFEEDSQQCLQAGMDAHLSKPVNIELLKTTLNLLLSSR